MLLAQSGIAGGLLAMAFCDPRTDLWWMVVFALVVAFSSATQDIALDAFRIEATDASLQGATAATYSARLPHRRPRRRRRRALHGAVRLLDGGLPDDGRARPRRHRDDAPDLGTSNGASPPARPNSKARSRPSPRASAAMPDWARKALIFVYGAIVCPFVDFFARFGWMAVLLLLFIGLFRLSDIAMGVDGQPVLHRHGLQQGPDRRRLQDLRLRR